MTGMAETKQLISIVPVRMTEAWLLFDEQAIRKAASNPSGRDPLKLPSLLAVDSIPDPKQQLKELLRQASGLSGRRLQKFNESKAIQLIADCIPDFSPLRKLAAFVNFEKSVQLLVVG